MYGKSGEKDNEVIDAHLAKLRKGAVVVNLGCGPNHQPLENFARAVGKCQFKSTLIFADLSTHQIQNNIWIPGPAKTKVVTLNAATATTILGEGRVDLIVALGLFGDLDSTTTDEGTGKRAWPAVLRECLRLLKPLGELIVSNSCDRQPFEDFTAIAKEAGFTIAHHHISEAIWGREKPGDQRYLIVCLKHSN
ncbi:MAG: class I SAM-dependent methyltransferase [Acidobacteriota bacterium]